MENRTLAKFPVFRNADGLNSNFGREFEAWLNDRFRGRKKLIRLNDRINALLEFNRKENDQAFEGENGWLFYKGDHSVELFQHRLPFSDKQMEKINNNIKIQQSWLKGKGISYALFIAPNKEDVYGEFYKPYVMQDKNEDRVQLLIEQLKKEDNDVPITYPLKELLSAKAPDLLLYWKRDTHWSEYGAYLGYLEWMKALKLQVADIDVLYPEQMVFQRVEKGDGDLARMLQLDADELKQSESYMVPVLKTGWTYKTVETHKDNTGAPKFIRTICPGKKYKVIVFRDSFSSNLIPYLSSTFGEVVYVWDHDLGKYADLIRKEKPDIVLHEMVSRYAQVLLQEMTSWHEEGK